MGIYEFVMVGFLILCFNVEIDIVEIVGDGLL